MAAAEADIVGFTGFSPRQGGLAVDPSGFKPAEVDRRLDWVRRDAGDRFGALELNVLVQRVVITEDRAQAADEIAAAFPALLPEDVLQTPFLLLGTADQILEQLVAHRDRWGFSYFVVFEPMAEALAPVVARLTGT